MKNFTRLLLFVLFFMGVTRDGKTQFSNALSYNSAFANYTTMPDGIVSGLSSNFTIETWVNWGGGSDFQRIFDFGNGTGSYMYLTPSENTNDFVQFGFRIPGQAELQLTGGTITLNQWTHIAITVDYSTPSAPVGNLYVGGNLVATGPMYSGAVTYEPSDLGVTTQNWLGRSQFSGAPFFDPFFTGIIDEFRISNTLRYTGASFTPALTPFVSDGNTVALYHFDEGSGQFTYDALYDAVLNPNAFGYLGSSSADNSQDPSWVLSTLPVKLISFSGEKADRTIKLQWRASMTGEEGRFVIERSQDGYHFQPIGNVPFSKLWGTYDYQFNDNSYLNDKNYYRLKIEEHNTVPVRSSVIIISKNPGFAVYPTNARDQIFVTVPKATNVAIYNSNGVLLKRIKLVMSQNIYLSGLTNGVYYLRFQETKQTIPFVKH